MRDVGRRRERSPIGVRADRIRLQGRLLQDVHVGGVRYPPARRKEKGPTREPIDAAKQKPRCGGDSTEPSVGVEGELHVAGGKADRGGGGGGERQGEL